MHFNICEKKIPREGVPKENLISRILTTDEGKWCFTDVVPFGRRVSKDKKEPNLTTKNKNIVEILKSEKPGLPGLIGGIKLLYYKGKNRNKVNECTSCGTAGIAVVDENGDEGLLTNYHVAVRGRDKFREIFHPDYNDLMFLAFPRFIYLQH